MRFFCAALAVFLGSLSQSAAQTNSDFLGLLNGDFGLKIERSFSSPPIADELVEREAASPDMVLWAIIKDQYKALRTVSTTNTAGGQPSHLILVSSDGNDKLPENFQLFFAMTAVAVRNEVGDKVVANDCPGEKAEYNTCCLQNPHSVCVPKIVWEYCPSNPICTNFQKMTFFTSVARYIGKEVAVTSMEVPQSEIGSGILPGGKNLFVWPYFVGEEQNFLITQVDADLVVRLTSSIDRMLNRVRKARDSAYFNFDAFRCTAAGITPVVMPGDLSAYSMLPVSYGESIDLIRPTSITTPIHQTLRFFSRQGVTYFRNERANSAPVGGENTALIDWFDAAPSAADWFPCVSPTFMDDFQGIKSLVNNRDNSNIIFGFVYLQGVLNEIAGGDKININ